MIIPAKDVGAMILGTLKDAIKEEYPTSTEAEREEVLATIFNSMSRSMFGGV